jgi:hypothetical protein
LLNDGFIGAGRVVVGVVVLVLGLVLGLGL